MSFQAAEENLRAGARDGLAAQLYWPEIGWISPTELCLRKLLPMAHAGLRELGMSDHARERYLGVIEQRCLARQNGSTWQRGTVSLLEQGGLSRDAALTAMLRRYVDLMHDGDPVHTWPTEG
jgi:hypothetical protein